MSDIDTTNPTKMQDTSPASTTLPRRRWIATGVVALVLLAGAATFNIAIAGLDLSFRKEPVPLRQPVPAIESELGPWVQVSVDTRAEPDTEKELGTLDYLTRTYVDTSKADPKVREEFDAAPVKTQELRSKLQNSVLSNDPFGLVTLHVAFYTGGVDTVPHIPDRCMVGSGLQIAERREIEMPILPNGETETVSFRQFEQSEGNREPIRYNVGYLFKVNGEYEHDAVTGVRMKLQDLTVSHAYFAKIEVSSVTTQLGTAKSEAAIANFLTYALPAIDEVLPLWPPADMKPAGSDADSNADSAEEAPTDNSTPDSKA